MKYIELKFFKNGFFPQIPAHLEAKKNQTLVENFACIVPVR